jgi:hypothetical protein
MHASSAMRTWSAALPDFDVAVETLRSVTHILRVAAADPRIARLMARAECDTGQSYCPLEWRTDDVESLLTHVRPTGAGE